MIETMQDNNFIIVALLCCSLLVFIPTWALATDVIRRNKEGTELHENMMILAGILNISSITTIAALFDKKIKMPTSFSNIRNVLFILAIASLTFTFYQVYQYQKRLKRLSRITGTKNCNTFQARVERVRTDMLFVKDIFIKVGDNWFPYSYPTSQKQMSIALYLKNPSEKQGIRKNDIILFRAVGSITIDRIHALVGCLQNGHNLKHLPEFEKSDIPDNLLSDILYQSEKQFCNSCLFAEICQHRKLPCVVISKKKGHWERDVMTKQYPQVIEDAIKRLQSDIGPSGYFGGVIKWFSDDVAKENGFEKACAILFCLQEGEPTNSQICAIEGEPITNSVILKKVLQKYQITGKTITVEIKYPYQNPTKKSLTLKDPHNTAEYLFSQMPYVGEKNDGWIYRSPEEMTNSINCIKKNL